MRGIGNGPASDQSICRGAPPDLSRAADSPAHLEDIGMVRASNYNLDRTKLAYGGWFASGGRVRGEEHAWELLDLVDALGACAAH